MHTVSTIAELRQLTDTARCEGQTVGFVPTMGFLHAGHASLMAAARAETDLVVSSIFVNPLQFAVGEDLSTYPRDLERDSALAVEQGVDLLFIPAVEEMYPRSVVTEVAVPPLASKWDGATRPTHFTGMATVVAKLFNIVGPCRAYFGEKDFQQLRIVKRMVSDLSLPVQVVGCPIVREPDGLAMSSRNTYLEPAERRAGVVLRRALDEALVAIDRGERDPATVVTIMETIVRAEPLANLDYACLVDVETLDIPDTIEGEFRLLIAAQVGRPRLIDNDGGTVLPEGALMRGTEQWQN
ncbi:MAG: pantoate--beta-alanine ligase [Candidatus Poriferisodalaceae bacterium]|jgi:pantoate--beta-alanine ligase